MTGVDDFVLDGDQTTTITLSIDDANSDDAFDLLADQTFLVTVTDDGCHSWQNCRNRFDVDGRDGVTPVDVLTLIVYLNAGNTSLPAPPATPPPFYDVNDDNACTPLDVLMVIVFINSQQLAVPGEGEAVPFPAPMLPPLPSAKSVIASSDRTGRLAETPWSPTLQTSSDEQVGFNRATARDAKDGMLLDEVDRTRQADANVVWHEGAVEELDVALMALEGVLTDLEQRRHSVSGLCRSQN